MFLISLFFPVSFSSQRVHYFESMILSQLFLCMQESARTRLCMLSTSSHVQTNGKKAANYEMGISFRENKEQRSKKINGHIESRFLFFKKKKKKKKEIFNKFQKELLPGKSRKLSPMGNPQTKSIDKTCRNMLITEFAPILISRRNLIKLLSRRSSSTLKINKKSIKNTRAFSPGKRSFYSTNSIDFPSKMNSVLKEQTET